MMPAAGESYVREQATLADAELTDEHIHILHGDRRPIRVQPVKTLVDVKNDDLIICCELPRETAITVLLDELLKPEPVSEESSP